jgi:hypothetical protein
VTDGELTTRLADAVSTLELNALAAQERGDILTWIMYSASALAAGELACAILGIDEQEAA